MATKIRVALKRGYGKREISDDEKNEISGGNAVGQTQDGFQKMDVL